ncbi:MAG: YfcC family protein [Bacteroidota bacterium]|nr:YfcC family protein [Bacteroidota bacterium]
MLKKIPDTLVIISVILLVFSLLTWIVPAGTFDRVNVDGRDLVVKDSYHVVEQQPQGISDLFKAPIKGFAEASLIIAFVFFVGGVFGIINATGAIEAGLTSMMLFFSRYPKYKQWVTPILFMLFAITGATFGLSEEVLVFVLITIPLFISLGYDSLLGIAVPLVGTAVGFGGAITNPFTVGIAQSIAELPLFSGWEYRLFCLFCLSISAILYILWYANRLEKSLSNSVVFELDNLKRKSSQNALQDSDVTFNIKRKLVLGFFFITVVMLIVGSSIWQWYIAEIGALFLGLAIVTSIIYKIHPNELVAQFANGAKEMLPACFVIAFSKAIIIIGTDGKIMDTILYALSHALQGFHPLASAEIMFLVQSLINIIVPSGSGQAALTMPILTPLSDIIGISRQTIVLIFQMGDGINNMIIPTSGVTMGTLVIAKIPYDVWVKWAFPLMIVLFITAMLLLIPPATFMYYGPR